MRAALATVLVLVAVGCGGDDSLSRGEWAAQANAICRESLKQVESLGQPATSDDYLRVTPKANEIGLAAIEDLRDLKAPGEIEEDAEAMIDGYERAVEEQDIVYRGLKAQREGTEPPRGDYFRAGNRAIEAGRSADEIAQRLRATDCARDPWQAPSQTIVCDVGPRDGLQNEPETLEPAVRAELASRLAAAGLPRVEAVSFVRDDRVPQMAGAEEVAARLPRDGAEFSGLVLNERGYERFRATGLARVNLTVAATDSFSRRNANASREEALAEWPGSSGAPPPTACPRP